MMKRKFTIFLFIISTIVLKAEGNLNSALSFNGFHARELTHTSLSDFTISATTTNETCTGNGIITLNAELLVVDEFYTFEIFNSSDMTTPLQSFSQTADQTTFTYNFDGLQHGNYTIKVTEDFDGVITSKTISNITILDKRTVLSYDVDNELICSSYDIIVSVKTGTAQSFELRNLSGSVIVPAQSNNTFTNVPAGNYRIYVVDLCGQVVTKDHTIVVQSPSPVTASLSPHLKDCNTYSDKINFARNGSNIIYPINYTVTYNNGTPVTITGQVTSGFYSVFPTKNAFAYSDEINFPKPIGSSYPVTVEYTDGCDTNYSFTTNVTVLDPSTYSSIQRTGCGGYVTIGGQNMIGPFTATFSQYPAGFDPNSYTPINGGIQIGNAANNPPFGAYTGTLYDSCGNSAFFGVDFQPVEKHIENIVQEPGCTIGYGNADFYIASGWTFLELPLTSATVITAPSGYTGSTNLNLSKGFGGYDPENTHFEILNAPEGIYKVDVKYICDGIEQSIIQDVEVIGYHQSLNNIHITKACGIFSIDFEHENNATSGTYFLERKKADGSWEFLEMLASSNSFLGYSNTTIFNGTNYNYDGDLRVVFKVYKYIDGNMELCEYVLKEFNMTFSIMLENFYVVRCSANKVSIIVDADSVPDLKYKIISKNGVPFLIDNGNNPVFTNLDSGVYVLEIKDGCDNTQEFTIAAHTTKSPRIRARLCNGTNGTLALPKMKNMNVVWTYNGGTLPANVSPDPTNNLILNFTPYNNSVHAGTYTATLTYNFANSCDPVTVSYTVSPTGDNNPQSGTGQTVTLDATSLSAPVNLFNYLTGIYSTNGTWIETTAKPSNLLYNNNWYAQLASPGTYTFSYTVDGTCTGTSTTYVTIIMNKVCYKPGLTDGNNYPTKHGITTLGRAGSQNDNWPMVRQSAHTVLEGKSKGFVLNRVSFDSDGNPIGISLPNWVIGMAVYDSTNNCFKVYFGNTIGWKCVNNKTCP